MIASTRAAGNRPGPLSEVPKNGIQPSVSCSQLAHRPDQRDHDEDAPQTEDHAGDRGQHLDDGPEYCGQARRQEILGQEDRDGDAEETADEQRQSEL